MTSRRDRRAGYALLATLWICVGLGALTWLISVNARDAMATSRNRMALNQAGWNAEACLARVREQVRVALELERVRGPDLFGAVWDHVDRVLLSLPGETGCTLSARPVGARLDVNAAAESTLARLLLAAGLSASGADAAAAAVSDWMDADDVARPLGGERAWYEAHNRDGPSNQPFVHMRELRRVRGLETLARLDSVLDVEPGPIALNHAVPEVLALLPGFTEATVRTMLEARARGTPVNTFHELTALLDPKAVSASAQLPGIVVFPATAWLVTIRTQVGDPTVTAVREIRLVRGSISTFVARKRAWVE
jgi:type II secretory pathway component PulK